MKVPTWKIIMIFGIIVAVIGARLVIESGEGLSDADILTAALAVLICSSIAGVVIWVARRPVKDGVDPKSMEAWRQRFGPTLKWLVPILIAIHGILFALYLLAR